MKMKNFLYAGFLCAVFCPAAAAQNPTPASAEASAQTNRLGFEASLPVRGFTASIDLEAGFSGAHHTRLEVEGPVHTKLSPVAGFQTERESGGHQTDLSAHAGLGFNLVDHDQFKAAVLVAAQKGHNPYLVRASGVFSLPGKTDLEFQADTNGHHEIMASRSISEKISATGGWSAHFGFGAGLRISLN